MSLLASNLFDFAQKASLTSRFAQPEFKSALQRQQRLAPAHKMTKPQVLYDRLKQAPIKLSLIDVLVLMGWRSDLWLSDDGQAAMQHWWQSALADTQRPVLRLIMMLRVVLADGERWPGPKPVIQAMSDEMQALIKRGQWPHPTQAELLLILARQEAAQLAALAFKQSQSVSGMMQQASMPTHIPVVLEAEEQWLMLWFKAQTSRRSNMAVALGQLLRTDLTLQRQQRLAKQILACPHVPQQSKTLKAQVANYPEIVAWLSACARQTEFKQVLNAQEMQLLRCWIGTGNYEALKGLLLQVAADHTDQDNIKKTENRYIFWRNYQDFFEETWLLLPSEIYHAAIDLPKLTNVRELLHSVDPIAVLKIGSYYIFQMFIAKGRSGQSDLMMTQDLSRVEELLQKPQISYDEIKQLNLCLIHDHYLFWQTDLAQTLDQNFGIKPHSGQIDITPFMHRSYAKEAEREEFQVERRKAIKMWLKSAGSRHSEAVLKKAALSAIRHGCL